MQFSSSLLENAVNEFARLPGIGRKTALRLVLHLLKQEPGEVDQFSEVLSRMRRDIKFCHRCHNVADADICSICANSMRRQDHVLGGVISPLDGIGPSQLNIDTLVQRAEKEETTEVIFALSPTIQGDTTIYYIQKKLKPGTRITTIARGISFGGELEYADEMTLARSLQNRLPIESYVSSR
jgi:recombination protein RecR